MEKFLLSDADCKNAIFDDVLTLIILAKCDMADAHSSASNPIWRCLAIPSSTRPIFRSRDYPVFNRSSMRRARLSPFFATRCSTGSRARTLISTAPIWTRCARWETPFCNRHALHMRA